MKRLLLGLALSLGLLASAFAVQQTKVIGDTDYAITNTDTWLSTSIAFTTARTWTLPYAGGTCLGQNCAPAASQLTILDTANAASVKAPFIIAPQSGDTINGSSASITVPDGGTRILVVPTSGSNWKLQYGNSTGFAIGTNPTVWHSGGIGVSAVATGTDSTAVNTETYIVQVDVLTSGTLTGVSWLGLATSTGNVQFCLADSAGNVITAACTASTATTGTANYQQAAFTAPYAVKGPGKYFILMQNSASNHYRSQLLGNFGSAKKTGETYGTFTAVTPPTTFTTGLGCVCDLY